MGFIHTTASNRINYFVGNKLYVLQNMCMYKNFKALVTTLKVRSMFSASTEMHIEVNEGAETMDEG